MLPISSKSTSTFIDATLSTVVELGGSMAIWSLPGSSHWKAILSFQPITIDDPLNLKEKQGFLFAPFAAVKSNSASFIQHEAELVSDGRGMRIIWHESVDEARRQAFCTSLQKTLEQSTHRHHVNKSTGSSTGIKEEFISLTHKALGAMSEGLFEKVVLATNKLVELDKLFSCGTTLSALKTLYPGTLVSLMSTPEYGTWLGASPEILLEFDNSFHARTVALAGTRQVNEGSINAWEEKEYIEHGVVTRYLHDLVNRMNIDDYSLGEVNSFKVGNLVHLKQELQWPASMFAAADVVEIMQELHPTPAVCGQPKDIARDFIVKNENFDRDFYAGFLGPANYDTRLSAYVNIRCMRLLDDKAELFAGAGITVDSSPEHEWEEVQAKLKVIENALSHEQNEQTQLDYTQLQCIAQD